MPHRTRTLPPEPTPAVIPGTDFLVPVEHVDTDEDAQIERIIRFLVGKMKKTYRAGSGPDVPDVFEDGHGLTTALLRGTSPISDEDLARLPEPLRVGLMRQAGDHPVIARFIVIDTTQGVVTGPRLSIKVGLEDREMDIVVAGFAPPPMPNFFIRDASDLLFVAGMPGSASVAHRGGDRRQAARTKRPRIQCLCEEGDHDRPVRYPLRHVAPLSAG